MTNFDQYMREGYTGRAEAFDRTFGRLCAYPAPALLDEVGATAGQRLLDVGCGSGTVAALAVERGATVTAVDVETSMLDLTRQRVPEAEVLKAALPRLPIRDADFDTVAANFVVNHVGDPLAAVAELRRVLRSGGRIGVTIWPQPPSTLHRLFGRVVTETGLADTVHPVRLPEDKDFGRDPEGLADLLTRAGFTAVTCRRVEWTHRVDAEVWWSAPAAGLHELGKRLAGQPAEVVARVKAHYDTLAAEFRTDTGELALPTQALLATGTAP